MPPDRHRLNQMPPHVKPIPLRDQPHDLPEPHCLLRRRREDMVRRADREEQVPRPRLLLHSQHVVLDDPADLARDVLLARGLAG